MVSFKSRLSVLLVANTAIGIRIAPVHKNLALPGSQVGISIAEQQHELEEHQASGPHRSRAAKTGQNLLRQDRLDEKQQRKEL